MKKVRFIDLFCGLGGMRLAFESAANSLGLEAECVFSADVKRHARVAYEANFGEDPNCDLTKVSVDSIPDFDYALGGFPCQAFSRAGKRMGFEDARGTLFFDVARIIKAKRPKGFLLENVEGLATHDGGRTLKVILGTLVELGYCVSWKVLDSSDFGMAQKRRRAYLAGTRADSWREGFDPFDFGMAPAAVAFGDVRERGLPVSNSKLNEALKRNFKDLSKLMGKFIKDKRGGADNVHSWDLGLRGEVSENGKKLMSALIRQRRYKSWAKENGTAWFDGMPLTERQISTFFDSPTLSRDLSELVALGHLKLERPWDWLDEGGARVKRRRSDLPEGYAVASGKLSFEFNEILDDAKPTRTINATDSTGLAVVEESGLRKLSSLELKRLFGFPEDYSLDGLTEAEIFDLFGNSVATKPVEATAKRLLSASEF